MSKLLVSNIGDLVTMAPLASQKRTTSVTDKDLGRHHGAWLWIENGVVKATGTEQDKTPTGADQTLDAAGGLVLPGLVDSHTHPLFAGKRSGEFWQRLSGTTYQEIAAAGGGIQASMRKTQEASDQELMSLCLDRLGKSRRLGVTTQEVKTGYGLTVAQEYRQLKLFQQIKDSIKSDKTLSITCLALHAKSPDHETLEDYVQDVTENLLPRVAKESLADSVDAFVEAGYFSGEQITGFLAKAKELGLAIRLHADEFTDAGAARLAAQWGALSADHMQFASPEGIAAMAKAGTIATILPGTSLYTGIPYTDGKRLCQAGVGVAIATDFNPGSCLIDNLAQMTVLASLNCGLTPAEALAGATYVAASALRLEERKGHLGVGSDGDFLIYDHMTLEDWFADFGQTPPTKVVTGGRYSN